MLPFDVPRIKKRGAFSNARCQDDLPDAARKESQLEGEVQYGVAVTNIPGPCEGVKGLVPFNAEFVEAGRGPGSLEDRADLSGRGQGQPCQLRAHLRPLRAQNRAPCGEAREFLFRLRQDGLRELSVGDSDSLRCSRPVGRFRELRAFQLDQELVERGAEAGGHSNLGSMKAELSSADESFHIPEMAEEMFSSAGRAAAAGHDHGHSAQDQGPGEGFMGVTISSRESGGVFRRMGHGLVDDSSRQSFKAAALEPIAEPPVCCADGLAQKVAQAGRGKGGRRLAKDLGVCLLYTSPSPRDS